MGASDPGARPSADEEFDANLSPIRNSAAGRLRDPAGRALCGHVAATGGVWPHYVETAGRELLFVSVRADVAGGASWQSEKGEPWARLCGEDNGSLLPRSTLFIPPADAGGTHL